MDEAGVELDLSRFPYEAARAIQGEGVTMLELLPPGLEAVVDGADIALFSQGTYVGRFPRARLADFDRELLRPYVATVLDQLPVGDADQVVAGINNGGMEIFTPPDADYVLVHVHGFRLCAVHRAVLIDGYDGV